MSDQIPNEQGPGLPHDDDLARLYRELPADEPRAEIDRAILQAARALPPRRGTVHALRWAVPMAAAAGVVLMFTLTRLTPELRDPEWIERDAPRQEMASADARMDAETERAALPTGKEKSALDETDAAVEADEALEEVEAVEFFDAKKADSAGPVVVAPPGQPMRSLGYIDEASPAPASPAPRPEPRAEVMAEAAPVPSKQSAERLHDQQADEPPSLIWPFFLEAGIDADEACGRLANELHVECSFHEDIATIPLPTSTLVDRGPWAGRAVKTIVLHARAGVLVDMEMELTNPQGGTERVHTKPAP